MLRLTRRTEYALIAMRHMAQQAPGGLSTAADLAERYSLPRELLAKTLQHMVRLKYLEPAQGSKGGYRLKVGLAEISMVEFLTGLEGPVALVACADRGECAIFDTCIIKSPLLELNAKMRTFLKRISVADITGKGPVPADAQFARR